MGFFSKLFSRKPPSQDQFAKMVIDCVRRAGEKGKIVYDPEEFRLRVEGETGIRMCLGNAYQEYCAVPEDTRAALMQNIARSWFVSEKETPEEYEDAKHDLLPVVRSRSYHENAKLLMACEGRNDADWPQQIIAEDLSVSLVYDLPEAMRTIRHDDLENWGITFYEALEVAFDNLRQIQHAFIGPKEGEGVYLSATHDNYDASRLLLLDTIRQLQVKGDFVATIPNRDTLIVTGSDDEDGLKGMLALTKDALQQPRMISGLTFRLDGEEWVPWMPDTTHPLYAEFRLLEVQSHGCDYEDQKGLLDKLHTKKQQDIFVASFMAMQNDETGDQVTFGVWSKGVLTLLPRTDKIAFIKGEKDAVMADWNRAAEVVGHLMEPLGVYPERFRVSEFPTDEQLKAMGAKKP